MPEHAGEDGGRLSIGSKMSWISPVPAAAAPPALAEDCMATDVPRAGRAEEVQQGLVLSWEDVSYSVHVGGASRPRRILTAVSGIAGSPGDAPGRGAGRVSGCV